MACKRESLIEETVLRLIALGQCRKALEELELYVCPLCSLGVPHNRF